VNFYRQKLAKTKSLPPTGEEGGKKMPAYWMEWAGLSGRVNILLNFFSVECVLEIKVFSE
jgi:hypothetical protein